jgi:hypothetical protein
MLRRSEQSQTMVEVAEPQQRLSFRQRVIEALRRSGSMPVAQEEPQVEPQEEKDNSRDITESLIRRCNEGEAAQILFALRETRRYIQVAKSEFEKTAGLFDTKDVLEDIDDVEKKEKVSDELARVHLDLWTLHRHRIENGLRLAAGVTDDLERYLDLDQLPYDTLHYQFEMVGYYAHILNAIEDIDPGSSITIVQRYEPYQEAPDSPDTLNQFYNDFLKQLNMLGKSLEQIYDNLFNMLYAQDSIRLHRHEQNAYLESVDFPKIPEGISADAADELSDYREEVLEAVQEFDYVLSSAFNAWKARERKNQETPISELATDHVMYFFAEVNMLFTEQEKLRNGVRGLRNGMARLPDNARFYTVSGRKSHVKMEGAKDSWEEAKSDIDAFLTMTSEDLDEGDPVKRREQAKLKRQRQAVLERLQDAIQTVIQVDITLPGAQRENWKDALNLQDDAGLLQGQVTNILAREMNLRRKYPELTKSRVLIDAVPQLRRIQQQIQDAVNYSWAVIKSEKYAYDDAVEEGTQESTISFPKRKPTYELLYELIEEVSRSERYREVHDTFPQAVENRMKQEKRDYIARLQRSSADE